MIKLNKLKFPTYRHLHVNYRDLKEKDSELLKGAQILKEIELDEKRVMPNEVFKDELDNEDTIWNISSGNFIVPEGENARGGFIFRDKKYQLNKCHVHLEKNSSATFQVFYDLDEGELLGELSFDVEEGAKLTLVPLFAQGRHIFTNIVINLLGENSEVHMEGAYICGEGSDYDINVEVNHIGRETKSLMNMHGYLDKGSRKTYKYTLNFERGVVDANGEENEVVTALDDDFLCLSVPVMLVGEDMIQASHGATLTPLDEEVLDYIKSRGIPHNLAERMCIMSGFQAALEEVDENLEEYFRERTDKILEKREERLALRS